MQWVVDSNIWLNLLGPSPTAGTMASITKLIQTQKILIYPIVLAEVAMGDLQDRQIINEMRCLPSVPFSWEQFHQDIEMHQSYKLGAKFTDIAILLAAQRHKAGIWTRDKKMLRIAEKLKINIFNELQQRQKHT